MSFFRKLTAVKPTDVGENEKKLYSILCLAGGGVALVAAVLLLILLAGFGSAYVWSALALGLCLILYFGLALLRYCLPHNKLVARLSDAAVYLTLVGAYTPIALLLVRLDVYENGSIVTGWVIFGIVAFFSLLFLIASLCSTRKFRLLGSFVYLLLSFALVFAIPALLNAFAFAPALGVVLPILAMLAFAASPVIFWFFDSKPWQMTVYYSLMVGGTFFAALTTLLWTFFGR